MTNEMARSASLLLILSLVVVGSGCGTSGAHHNTTALPGSRVAALETFYVVHRDGDPRNIEEDIAKQLRDLGLRATTGAAPPADPGRYDAIVTYIDRYMWDISMYCIQLSIYIEDTRTGFITATGSSWRPSIVRKTPAGHAKLLLTELFGADS